jgi:Ser-tRNA(Ala) deacylase AlaX
LNKDIKNELQKKVDELTSQDLKFSWSFEPLEALEKEAIYYLQPGLPKNKPLRALRLDGIGAVADGGTIVSSTQEVGKILILSIDTSEAETTIRYQLEG